MERLDLDQLADDPIKFAQAFANEMATLAGLVRATGEDEATEQMDRCLLLAGMAAGHLLRKG